MRSKGVILSLSLFSLSLNSPAVLSLVHEIWPEWVSNCTIHLTIRRSILAKFRHLGDLEAAVCVLGLLFPLPVPTIRLWFGQIVVEVFDMSSSSRSIQSGCVRAYYAARIGKGQMRKPLIEPRQVLGSLGLSTALLIILYLIQSVVCILEFLCAIVLFHWSLFRNAFALNLMQLHLCVLIDCLIQKDVGSRLVPWKLEVLAINRCTTLS